ncbi:MAG: hypothetical protein II712_05520, partial [Erysipelotrichaceae bacterium]|nr:hypothetical protein [Erysipelotrichaceae bacterium]
ASSLFGTASRTPIGQTAASSPATEANPSFQMPPQLQKMKAMMNMMRFGGNPQAMVQSMLSSSPQGSMVMNLIQQHGGDARAAFYDLAKQKGADPNQVLEMLK